MSIQNSQPTIFNPQAHLEIKTNGTTINPADGLDANANQEVVVNGRNTQYQRILVNQSITANGNISVVVDFGKLGTKAVNLVYSCVGTAYLSVYPCDANGNRMTSANIANTNTTGYVNNSLTISEIGGVRYLAIYVYDKSAATNTCNFVDVVSTFS